MPATLPPQNVITTDDISIVGTERRAADTVRRRPSVATEETFSKLAVGIAECRSATQAAQFLATNLVGLLGGGRAAVGLVPRSQSASRLVAISSTSTVDSRSDRAQAVQSALDEVLLGDEETSWQSGTRRRSSPGALPLKAHEQIATLTGSRTVTGCRLRRGDDTIAVVLWYDEGSPCEASAAQRVIQGVAKYAGPVLSAVIGAERSAASRLAERMREVLGGQRKKWILIGSVLVAGVLLFPLPYRVECRARLEPTTHRYIAAPFEAVLQSTLVRPGDLVKTGETVALLDGREVRWELASVESELRQAKKRYDAALAAQKTAEAELARLKAEALQFRLRQLRRHEEELQIKSPVSGVILSGELERAQGAALTTGQTLLEIAPLDELLVEVEVPDDHLQFVDAGTHASVKLDAFGGQTWRGQVERLRPMGEIRDQQNVFIAELSVQNKDGRLRPGMEGRAKVTGPIRPLGWILFHRPYRALSQWLGW